MLRRIFQQEALIAHLKLEIEKLRRAALRHALGAQGAAAGADGASAGRAGGGGDRGRTGGRAGGGADADRAVVPAQAAVAQAVPRSPAARARRDRRAGELSLLRLGEAVEAGRGHHRDAGGDPAPVEGDPDGAREVLVPGLRDDHAAAGAVPCDAARLCRPEPAGHDPVREVRPASAAEPAERALPRARASI